MRPKLFFLHIPKTAGTALNELLAEQYEEHETLAPGLLTRGDHYVPPPTLKHDKDLIRSLKLVRGHFNNRQRKVNCPEHFAFTVLREPRARIVSFYNDWSTKSDENLQTAAPDPKRLIEFVREHTLLELLRSDDEYFRSCFHDAQARQIADRVRAPLDETTASRAVEQLAQFNVVGITEQLDLTLAVLWDRMGWGRPPSLPKLNTSRGNLTLESLDEETSQELDRVTQADRVVYQAAVRRLGRDSAALLRQRSSTPLTASHGTPSASTPETLTLDMAGPAPGEGWHVREGVGTDRVWRWTGPERWSTFHFLLNPRVDYRIVIHVISEFDPQILDTAHLLAGETPLELTRSDPIDGLQRVESVVHAELVNPAGPTRFTLLVPRTMSHAEIQPETKDYRLKGVAITQISAEPVVESVDLRPHIPIMEASARGTE